VAQAGLCPPAGAFRFISGFCQPHVSFAQKIGTAFAFG
jgi:hypothetical protein